MTDATSLRVDKWLWQARFFKTRSLASKIVAGGKLRIDGVVVSKPARAVAPGAVLTFVQGDRVRVVRVLSLPTRRGPAPEAQAHYEDLTEEAPKDVSAPKPRAGGRPTKRDRRRLSQVLE